MSEGKQWRRLSDPAQRIMKFLAMHALYRILERTYPQLELMDTCWAMHSASQFNDAFQFVGDGNGAKGLVQVEVLKSAQSNIFDQKIRGSEHTGYASKVYGEAFTGTYPI
jgi:hypothetical protein